MAKLAESPAALQPRLKFQGYASIQMDHFWFYRTCLCNKEGIPLERLERNENSIGLGRRLNPNEDGKRALYERNLTLPQGVLFQLRRQECSLQTRSTADRYLHLMGVLAGYP